MPRLRYVIPAILLAVLISFSIYEQQKRGTGPNAWTLNPAGSASGFQLGLARPFFRRAVISFQLQRTSQKANKVRRPDSGSHASQEAGMPADRNQRARPTQPSPGPSAI